MIGQALLNLADIANCVSGDFHSMHLNFKGRSFDRMHKDVLKEYYEQAAEDYDLWAEAALMFDDVQTSPTPNNSAERIEWQSCEGECNVNSAVARAQMIIEAYMEAATLVFRSLEKDGCMRSIGVASTVQTRIEYWSKELYYFNNRRVEE
jgi:DNA-binding ferritin-like protein